MNANITEAMLRYGIGLNPHFFERSESKSKFPPHNITQLGKDRYRLTLAVAGYSREELKVTIQGEKLTVYGTKEGSVQKASGEWTDSNPVQPTPNYLMPVEEGQERVVYRGIAFRNFTSEFMIGQHVHVEGVTLKNGLLDIDLARELPEAEKLKEIPITA